MTDKIKEMLKSLKIKASAPCRIDLGGTLDIRTFYYPLGRFMPCTFNIALDLRTYVNLLPFDEDAVKVTSHGFESAVFSADDAPFDHPLGLMFAIASYFRANGVHIKIQSLSPPKSALGGSSTAAVALVAAFSKVFERLGKPKISRQKTAILAHAIEESVAGVPCGLQDQLSAAYGGVNAWYWNPDISGPMFRRRKILNKRAYKNLQEHILIAYCGIPHESKNINTRWIRQFLSGKNRGLWVEIIECSNSFIGALSLQDYSKAAKLMNKETEIRRIMTPDVLDDTGTKLADLAIENSCGARFTGAGGGGCVWAIGEKDNISKLKRKWEKALSSIKNACLLNANIDPIGLT